MTIETCASLGEFFLGAVTSALRNQGVHAEPATQEYLADLLVTFADRSAAEFLDRSVVLILDDAMASLPGERLLKLQSAGDGALCLSGLFVDHATRGDIDVGVYRSVGVYAYRTAAELTRRFVGSEPVALTDLGEHFPVYADVLAEVAESSALGGVTRSIVQLYDRWKSAGSHRALEELARRGAFPSSSGEGRC